VQPASLPGQPRASHHTSLPSLLQPPSFRRFRQPTSPSHHHNALQRSPTPRAALQATEKSMVNPFRLFTAPSTESFRVASSVVYTPSPSPASPNTPSEDSSRRLPAGPQPSSSFRGAAAAGICVQLVWSAASSGLPASPTSCSRPIRPVTSIPQPFAPHQPARPAASTVCRAQWMRMPAGALGRHPGSRAKSHSRLIMALGSRPSALAGRCREAAAQQPRCGGAALAAAAILAAAARPSHQPRSTTCLIFVFGMLPS